jgi:acylphosphatase
MSARDEALGLSLVGWVRNLPGGDVEGEVQGEASAVDSFLAWCARGPLGARVDRLDVHDRVVADDLNGFAIRR